MKIAQISSCWVRTPPYAGYGGTEWVVSYLTEELVSRGHEVTLFATGDSETTAKLWSWYAEPMTDFHFRHEIVHCTKAFNAIRRAGFDVVHNHTYNFGAPLLSLSGIPSLTTIHGGYHPSSAAFYEALSDSHNFVAISNRQRTLMPNVNWLGTVHNGLRVSDFPFSAKKDDYVLFAGLMVPWKSPHIAIEAAKVTGLPLKLIGPVREQEREYYEQRVAPFIDQRTVQYLGEVGFKEKVQLFSRARVLLVPMGWEEPFGLVMIEALACGTPVIAFGRGAAPEIVTPGVGYLVNGVVEMVAALGKIAEISPTDCRDHIERNFTASIMADRYVDLYQQVLTRPLGSGGL